MPSERITLTLPAPLAALLRGMADDDHQKPTGFVGKLVEREHERRTAAERRRAVANIRSALVAFDAVERDPTDIETARAIIEHLCRMGETVRASCELLEGGLDD